MRRVLMLLRIFSFWAAVSATGPRGNLAELVAYLRAGDDRLVRPGPWGQTTHRQVELAEAGVIESTAAALWSPDARERASAAELVHLLTTNNPVNRGAWAKTDAARSLTAMVRRASAAGAPENEVRGGEEAAESIWILAFAGGGAENAAGAKRLHARFAEHGADEALVELVLRPPSPRAAMWAAAAIGNLAAAYGDVAAGLGAAVRSRALQGSPSAVVAALVAMISAGPVTAETEDHLWPSRATTKERLSPTILAWGAGQALKNIALDASSHRAILEAGGLGALCRLRHSPDWLEKMKADATLGHLGVPCDQDEL